MFRRLTATNTYMNYLTCPQSPVTQRGGGHRPKLQRIRTGGLLSSWHCAAGKVFKRSLLLHRTIRCLNPGPHFGVHWKNIDINKQLKSQKKVNISVRAVIMENRRISLWS